VIPPPVTKPDSGCGAMAFVHLHVHSQFSILDGTATVEALADRAAKLGMPALALTDSANLFGAVAFYKACKSRGIKAILGAELHVQPEGIGYADPLCEHGGYQVVALVEDERGYRNLCQLVTRAIFDGNHYKPRVDLDLLRAHHEGLVLLTGGRRGATGRPLLEGRPAEALERVRALADIVGDDHLFLELQDLGLPGHDVINEGARRLAAELGLRTVVTNAVHYLDPEDAAILAVLHSIGAGCSLSEPRVQPATDQAWLRTLTALFKGRPEIAHRLIIEITETTALYDIEESARFVSAVRDLGCRVAVDDFGAGFTSFRQLRALSADIVKLDGSFVRNLAENVDNQLFIRNMLGVAEAFNLETVAEGVETRDEAAFLVGEGVRYLQGYHFGRPEFDRPWLKDASHLPHPAAVG